MVLYWAAAALLMTEQNLRKIMGYRDLWMLKAALDQKGDGRRVHAGYDQGEGRGANSSRENDSVGKATKKVG